MGHHGEESLGWPCLCRTLFLGRSRSREGLFFHYQFHSFRHETCSLHSSPKPSIKLQTSQTPAPSALDWIVVPDTCPWVLSLLVFSQFLSHKTFLFSEVIKLHNPGWLQDFSKTAFQVVRLALIPYETKDELELIIIRPPHANCWDYGCSP